MKLINKSALVAEINRLIAELVEEGKDTMFEQGRISAFENVKLFLNTLEEPTNEDLEEAAYNASLNNFVDPECLDDDELHNFDWIRYYEQVFKTGALWQKRQDSIEVKEVDLEKCKEYDKALSIAKAWYKSSDSSAQERNVALMIMGEKVREPIKQK